MRGAANLLNTYIGTAANNGEACTTRMRLRNDLRDEHEALHDHPLMIGSTTSESFQSTGHNVLRTFYLLFEGIERNRREMDCWRQFSLSPDIILLKNDIQNDAYFKNHYCNIKLDCEHAVLGALYVAIGSNFGKSVLRKRFIGDRMMLNSAYLLQKPNPAIWSAFCRTLNEVNLNEADYVKSLEGSKKAFSEFKRLADSCQIP